MHRSFKYSLAINPLKPLVLILLLLLFNNVIALSIQPLLDLPTNTNHFSILHHTLRQLTQKLLLRRRPEVLIRLRLKSNDLLFSRLLTITLG